MLICWLHYLHPKCSLSSLLLIWHMNHVRCASPHHENNKLKMRRIHWSHMHTFHTINNQVNRLILLRIVFMQMQLHPRNYNTPMSMYIEMFLSHESSKFFIELLYLLFCDILKYYFHLYYTNIFSYVSKWIENLQLRSNWLFCCCFSQFFSSK